MLRKLAAVLLTIAIIVAPVSTAIAESTSTESGPAITATSAILVDAKSGQILFEKNSHERRSIASTTKIMTAIITLERAKLSDEVAVSKSASAVGESELFLQPGERMTIENLLYGLLLQSGNDVAAALADYVGGSIEGFAELMNRKARSIGAQDTHFANPHGLYNPDHYSTAYDLALIARYCMNDQTFSRIVATKEYPIPRPSKSLLSKIKNHNKLLWQYPYTNGIKTGYIRQAGHCLVSSANKNGVQLIAVVLNSPNSDACLNDSKSLLEYGFNEFKVEKLIMKGREYKKVKLPELYDETLGLVASDNLIVQIRRRPESISKKVIAKNIQTPPIKKGEKLGEVEVFQFGNSLGKVNLLAAKDFPKPNQLEMIFLWIKYFFRKAAAYLM